MARKLCVSRLPGAVEPDDFPEVRLARGKAGPSRDSGNTAVADAAAPARRSGAPDSACFLDDSFISAWRRLGDSATDRNVFFEPWLLQPALDHLAPPSGKVELVAAYADDGELAGLVPLIKRRPPLGRIWSVWSHTHCFDNTPLCRAGEEDRFLERLFEWLEQRKASILFWPSFATDTVFADRLSRFLEASGRRFAMVDPRQRPMLRADALSFEALADRTVSRNRRKGLARRRRRLEELGRVAWRVDVSPAGVAKRAASFLELEANGWKGRQATAILCRPPERAFFEAAARQGAELGKVMVQSLELEDRPVAMTVNFRSGSRMWAFKIAVDENLRVYAPGILAEVEGTREALEDPSVTWFDSCAGCGESLLGELWPHRRPLSDLLVAVLPGEGRMVPALHAAVRAKRAMRGCQARLAHLLGVRPRTR